MTFLIPSHGHESLHTFFLHLFAVKVMVEEEVLTQLTSLLCSDLWVDAIHACKLGTGHYSAEGIEVYSLP